MGRRLTATITDPVAVCIETERLRRGLSRAKVQELAGIHGRTWDRLVRDSAWQASHLRAVARVLGMPVERLTEVA